MILREDNCFSMETSTKRFFFFHILRQFHSSEIMPSLLFLSINLTFLIIHFKSVRISSNEETVLEASHLNLLSSYFIFKDLFSTILHISYLSYNSVSTIEKKINCSIFFFSKKHVIAPSFIFFNPHSTIKEELIKVPRMCCLSSFMPLHSAMFFQWFNFENIQFDVWNTIYI